MLKFPAKIAISFQLGACVTAALIENEDTKIFPQILQNDASFDTTGRCTLGVKWAARGINLLTFFCASMLALCSPEYASKKFKIKKPSYDMSSNARWLLHAIGWCNLSTAVTTAPLLYNTSLSVWSSIALGTIPRAFVTFYYYVQSHPQDFTMVIHSYAPVYACIVACTSAIFHDSIPMLENMDPATGVIFIANLYIISGVALMVAPTQFSAVLNYDVKKDKLGKGLLRAKGKTDVINGALLWGLATGVSVEKAIGISCSAWAVSILLCDFIFEEYAAMGKPLKSVLVQLLIAVLASAYICFDT